MSKVQILGRFEKQPAEILDYQVDYADWFENRSDAPASFVTVIPTGITEVSSSRSGTVVTVVLAGGDADESYKITVRLTTSAGLVKEADFIVRVKEV